MNERTRSYLAGRFRDYYRRCAPTPTGSELRPRIPPDANAREWAHIPFTTGSSPPMMRHQALVDGDELATFLTGNQPRHVYHSAARYDDPGAGTMAAKGWRGADLVFDLDADHLPSVDADADAYADMLRACRTATAALVDILVADFGFDDLQVVFSGNRGYHVHVRDAGVDDLGREARREVVDYVRGEGLTVDALIQREAVVGASGTHSRRHLETDAGWGRRAHAALVDYLADRRDEPKAAAIEALTAFPGIGEHRAETVQQTVAKRWEDVTAGEVDLHPDFVRFVRTFIEERVVGAGPAIDDPVTTDVHRLIRLPGSLHGATGLVVRPIPTDELTDFDPLEAAICPVFRSVEITIDVTTSLTVDLDGRSWTLEPGPATVPEFVGIYAMTRGHAEKTRE